jgi:flavin reductase (DIM6/NTAB) family NADH-FMN oxidoreductase RutF
MVSESDFRHALSQFATGVTIVTTRDGSGRPLGLTVNAFCSVSLTPPLVLVCIDRRSDAHAGFSETGLFNISVLAEDQQEISRRFALRGAVKFEGASLPAGQNGVPVVQGAVAVIECRVSAAHSAGDHMIYVGEVTRLETRAGRPLLYHGSTYRRIDPGSSEPAP